jgi:hypothetical protein
MKALATSLLLALMIVSCDSPTAFRLGNQFWLGYGQSVTLAQTRLSVRFKTLKEDSRCPENLDCIWAGNAAVIISLSGEDVLLNTYLDPKEVSRSGYRITLLAVRPYPGPDKQYSPQEYHVRLVVTEE